MKFQFLIRGRNCEDYIERCIRSLERQYVDWGALLILDNPTDSSHRIARGLVHRNSFKIIVNKKRQGLCKNMYDGLKAISGCGKDTVVCIVDADDYLMPDAIVKVARKYEKKPELLLTYGSYIKKSKSRKTRVSKPYKYTDNVRSGPWHASHLKTFKAKLIPYIKEEWFKHDGEWMEAASDVALMVPLIESVGLDRTFHISEPIYMWRDSTPYKTKVNLQKKCHNIIKKKPIETRINI